LKTIKKLLFMFAVLIIGLKPVFAACDYKEKADLNKEASYIKLNYQIINKICDETDNWCDYPPRLSWSIEVPTIDISILNVNSKFDFKVERFILTAGGIDEDATYSLDDAERYYYGSNAKDGIISFTELEAETLKQYKVEIRTSNETNCPGELIKVLYKNIPRFNDLSGSGLCVDYEHLPECEKFTFLSEIDYDDVERAIVKDTKVNKIPELVENKNLVIPLALIGGGVIIILIVALVLRSKKNEKTK